MSDKGQCRKCGKPYTLCGCFIDRLAEESNAANVATSQQRTMFSVAARELKSMQDALAAMTARATKAEAELARQLCINADNVVASGVMIQTLGEITAERDAVTASRDRLAAELRIILNGNVCDQYEKWAKGRIRIALRQGGYLEEPNAKA